MEVLVLALLNTISFLLNHIAQQSATTPDKIWLSITDLFVGVEHRYDHELTQMRLLGGAMVVRRCQSDVTWWWDHDLRNSQQPAALICHLWLPQQREDQVTGV